MPRSFQQPLPPVEVKRVDAPRERDPEAVKNLDPLQNLPIRMAKVGMGQCIGKGFGSRALKEFGDPGQMSNVMSGEKVPEYLARIYADPSARLRFALSLLKGNKGVRILTTVEIDDEVAL